MINADDQPNRSRPEFHSQIPSVSVAEESFDYVGRAKNYRQSRKNEVVPRRPQLNRTGTLQITLVKRTNQGKRQGHKDQEERQLVRTQPTSEEIQNRAPNDKRRYAKCCYCFPECSSCRHQLAYSPVLSAVPAAIPKPPAVGTCRDLRSTRNEQPETIAPQIASGG
jgi:hypothetical protein